MAVEMSLAAGHDGENVDGGEGLMCEG